VKFSEVEIPGVFLVALDVDHDERGAFVRTFDRAAFAAHGLVSEFPQHSISWNRTSGTLRGLHFQAAPDQEAKLVRCASGEIYDVVVDLRDASPTKGQWFAVELRAADLTAIYIPEGCAHGFQTLRDDTEVSYLISAPHAPGSARGIRWDDPGLAIPWPDAPPSGRVISARDRSWPDFAW
jgi:dTDP-4-dehydrorhamnose 3,5-epimerase